MEQSVRLTSITITGSAEPKDNAFSKTFLYRPANSDLHARRGELYACLSLASPDPSLDLENLANQILTCLSESYFNQKEGSVLEAISMASNSAQKRALEITHREGGQIPLDFSLTAAAVWGKAAFITLFGGGYAALFRGSELLPETSNRLFSEELKDKDVLVLATPLFATRIDEEKIAEILREVSAEEWVEKFREIISTKEEQSRLAAVFLKVEIEEVPGEEEVIEILEVPKQEPIYTPLLRTCQKILLKFPAFARHWRTSAGRQTPSLPAQAGTIRQLADQIQKKLENSRNLIFRIWLPLHWRRKPEIYLKEQKPSDRGKKLAIVGGLILLLIVSILGTRWWNRRNERKKEISQLLSQAEEKISQGEKTATINPDKAKKLLDEAQDSLGKVKGMQVSQKEIGGLETKIEEILAKAYNTEKIESILIADLGLKIAGGEFKELIKLGEKVYSLDTKSGKLAEVNLEDENKVNVLNFQFSIFNFQFLTGYLDFLYIFDPKQGIIEINRNTGSSNIVIPTDLRWKEVVALESYMGNLYLLDPPSNQIFKYITIETGFSKLFTYFTQNVDLNKVKNFTIDGAIFLVFDDSRVEKYLGGVQEEFSLSGLYPPFAGASQIYTDPDAEKLYLTTENFILIFGKNGSYEKRLQLEEISQIEGLVIDEEKQKLWILANQKVYEVNQAR